MSGLRGRLLLVACGGLILNLVVLPLRALGYLSQSDFVPFDAAGRIVRSGGCLYCLASQEAAVHGVAGTAAGGGLDSIGGLVFISPPAVAYLFAPFAGFDPHVARLIFMALSLAALAMAGWLIARRLLPGLPVWQRIAVVIAGVASVPAAIGITGQIDPVIFGAVVAGIVVSRRHPLIGGVLIGALALKPQLLVLVPVALVVGRHWRVLFGVALSVTAVGGTMLLHGFGHFLDWPRFVADYGSLSSWLPQSIPAVTGWLVHSGTVLFGMAALCVTAGAIVLWLRRETLDSVHAAVGFGVALSMIASPHLFGADLVFLAIPLTWLALQDANRAIMLALCVSVAGMIDVETAPLAIAGPLVLLAIVVTLISPLRVLPPSIELVGRRQRSSAVRLLGARSLPPYAEPVSATLIAEQRAATGDQTQTGWPVSAGSA